MQSISRKDQSKIVDNILKEAVEFPSQEAYDKYMKQHPDADPKHHKVVEKKTKNTNEKIKEKIKEKKKQLAQPKEQVLKNKLFNAPKDMIGSEEIINAYNSNGDKGALEEIDAQIDKITDYGSTVIGDDIRNVFPGDVENKKEYERYMTGIDFLEDLKRNLKK